MMSLRYLVAVLYSRHAALQDAPKLLVMIALADHANDDGICWPSVPRVAALARLSDRHATRMIRALETDDRLISVTRRRGAGHTNTYQLHMQPLISPPPDAIAESLNLPGAAVADELTALTPKPDTPSPLYSVGKHDTVSYLHAENKSDTVSGLQNNGDRTANKPDKSADKPDIAMSSDPVDPNDPLVDYISAWNETMAECKRTFPAAVYDQFLDGATIEQTAPNAYAITLKTGVGLSWVQTNAIHWLNREFNLNLTQRQITPHRARLHMATPEPPQSPNG